MRAALPARPDRIVHTRRGRRHGIHRIIAPTPMLLYSTPSAHVAWLPQDTPHVSEPICQLSHGWWPFRSLGPQHCTGTEKLRKCRKTTQVQPYSNYPPLWGSPALPSNPASELLPSVDARSGRIFGAWRNRCCANAVYHIVSRIASHIVQHARAQMSNFKSGIADTTYQIPDHPR